MQSLLMNSLFHFIFTSANLSAGIASSAIPADQPGIISSTIPADQPVAPSVSIYFLFQEQDSPDSLFSFAIEISEDEGEEASSSRAVGITSAEIRAKLEDLSAPLHQDTTQLVDDSDPAKTLFKTLRGQILPMPRRFFSGCTLRESTAAVSKGCPAPCR